MEREHLLRAFEVLYDYSEKILHSHPETARVLRKAAAEIAWLSGGGDLADLDA